MGRRVRSAPGRQEKAKKPLSSSSCKENWTRWLAVPLLGLEISAVTTAERAAKRPIVAPVSNTWFQQGEQNPGYFL